MEDFFDDFDDDEGESMDENSFEDEYDPDTEMEDPLDGDSDLDDGPDEAKTQAHKDDSTAKDAFIIGGSMVWDLEEVKERRRRKQKYLDDDFD